jgi:hypothetical protein
MSFYEFITSSVTKRQKRFCVLPHRCAATLNFIYATNFVLEESLNQFEGVRINVEWLAESKVVQSIIFFLVCFLFHKLPSAVI